jgi:hypothetical protein
MTSIAIPMGRFIAVPKPGDVLFKPELTSVGSGSAIFVPSPKLARFE